MTDPNVLNGLNFLKSFWYSWSTDIDDDVDITNRSIMKENATRKE